MLARWRLLAAVLFGCVPMAAIAQSSLPDRAITPGVTNPTVGAHALADTVCRPGWTIRVRPAGRITEALKRRQIGQYGYADRRLGSYQEDHLVPLELGGAPADPRNLWPEPRNPPDGWTSARKDELEHALHDLVCAHRLGLAEAQRAIAADWHAAYLRFIGPPGSASAMAAAPRPLPAPAKVPASLGCDGDRLVWVNLRSRVYHTEGARYFGTTTAGKYTCETQARHGGARPSRNGQ